MRANTQLCLQPQARRKCPFLIMLLALSNENAVSTVLSSAYIGHKGWTDTVIAIMICFQEVSVLEKHVSARRFSRTRLFTPGRILHITYVKKSAADKWVFLAHVVPSICLQISFSQCLGHTKCHELSSLFSQPLLPTRSFPSSSFSYSFPSSFFSSSLSSSSSYSSSSLSSSTIKVWDLSQTRSVQSTSPKPFPNISVEFFHFHV